MEINKEKQNCLSKARKKEKRKEERMGEGEKERGLKDHVHDSAEKAHSKKLLSLLLFRKETQGNRVLI